MTTYYPINIWVYIQSEPSLWTVGFYAPDGTWHTDSDHDNRQDARERVHYLNGDKNSRSNKWQAIHDRANAADKDDTENGIQ